MAIRGFLFCLSILCTLSMLLTQHRPHHPAFMHVIPNVFDHMQLM